MCVHCIYSGAGSVALAMLEPIHRDCRRYKVGICIYLYIYMYFMCVILGMNCVQVSCGRHLYSGRMQVVHFACRSHRTLRGGYMQ
jgi:hypothetical protein